MPALTIWRKALNSTGRPESKRIHRGDRDRNPESFNVLVHGHDERLLKQKRFVTIGNGVTRGAGALTRGSIFVGVAQFRLGGSYSSITTPDTWRYATRIVSRLCISPTPGGSARGRSLPGK